MNALILFSFTYVISLSSRQYANELKNVSVFISPPNHLLLGSLDPGARSEDGKRTTPSPRMGVSAASRDLTPQSRASTASPRPPTSSARDSPADFVTAQAVPAVFQVSSSFFLLGLSVSFVGSL